MCMLHCFRRPSLPSFGLKLLLVTAYVPNTASNDYEKSLTQQDMAQLRAWGLNVLRLGVMWPGVEPVEGQCVAARWLRLTFRCHRSWYIGTTNRT